MATKTSVAQEGRLLELETPLGANTLLINHFSGHDAISSPFLYRLDLLAEPGQKISFDDLIGRNISVKLQLADSEERYFHGVLGSIRQGRKDNRWVHYQADLHPWLWLMTLRSNCRIFQDKSIPEIVKALFDDLRGSYPEVSYRDALTGDHIKLDYCAQYRETDFSFVSRLLEQDGIFYFFEHEKNKHTLVLADSNSAFQACPVQSRFKFREEGGYSEREDTIAEWYREQQLRSGKYSLRDHNFELPSKTLEVAEPTTIHVGNNDDMEVYDYPGEYARRFNSGRVGNVEPEGRKLVRLRMEEIEVPARTFRGNGDARTLHAGFKFNLEKHYQCDGEYVLTSVEFSTGQSPDYISENSEGGNHKCSFTCVDSKTPMRPLRLTPKPIVQGPQTAVVTVKKGEESWLDKYGRVRVQFPWDRAGKTDEQSTCWLRVAQPWAANQWGAHFWPRVGQEVVVEFLEGDPDRPIVTGSVYNAAQMPPYPLPQYYTRSGIKTRSTKNGSSDNYNELRFEDKKDAEQIYLQAEKDMDVRIKNDLRQYVEHDRHVIINHSDFEVFNKEKHVTVFENFCEYKQKDEDLYVGGTKKELIEQKNHLHVKQDHIEKIDGNMSLTVGESQQEKVGSKLAVDAGQEIHLKAGMKVIIEAGTQVTLKGAGGFVDIGPSGVTIQGNMVLINSGGAAGSGSGSNPQEPEDPFSPLDPDEADDGSKGAALQSRQSSNAERQTAQSLQRRATVRR